MSTNSNGWPDLPEQVSSKPEPEVRNDMRRAWVLWGVTTTLALIAMFQVPLGVSALRAESDYNYLTELTDSSVRDTYEKMESRPGFSDFQKDEVWASPEWKAIAEAQEQENNEQMIEPIREQMLLDTEAATWPWSIRVQGAANGWIESITRPIETSPPLTEQSFIQGAVVVMYTWAEGQRACQHGDVDSYLASDQERMAPAPRGSRLHKAWIENSDKLVRTAAGYQCSNSADIQST